MPNRSFIIALLIAASCCWHDSAGQVISTTFQDTLLCKGRPIMVPYTITGTFNTGNIFSVELSDATGSFASPVMIGSIAATTGGTISGMIPTVIASGTNYRIRITSSSPVTISANNGIDIRISDIPAKPTATHSTPVCSGRDMQLMGSSTTAGVSYHWTGYNNFTSNQQNAVVSNMIGSPTTPVMYILQTALNGCSSEPDTVSTLVELTPFVSTLYSNSPLCPGDTLRLSLAANPGTGIYFWNGPNSFSTITAGGSTFIYPFSINDTGIYKISMLSSPSSSCFSDTSQVHVFLANNVNASVHIGAVPGVNVGPWTNVTFTATPTNGGTAPTYQWLLNGQPVPGATSATWSSYSLAENDMISVVMTNNHHCTATTTDTSNVLTIHINTGVNEHKLNHDLQLYPNPNNGDFTIKGNAGAGNITIEVWNIMGQRVYSKNIQVGSSQAFEYPIQLDAANGVYLLKVSSEQGTVTWRFIIQ